MKIVRRRESKKLEKLTLQVSHETIEKWDEVGKALAARGFEIDTDQAVRRIIKSLEAVLKPEGEK